MDYRTPVNKKASEAIFERNALRTHTLNNSNYVSRGGIRL